MRKTTAIDVVPSLSSPGSYIRILGSLRPQVKEDNGSVIRIYPALVDTKLSHSAVNADSILVAAAR